MNTDSIIYVENLCKKFGDFTAVNNLCFEVKKGEIFGFLGANGAGKTTAVKMLCGLLKPTSGSAWVAGYDVNRQPDMIKKNIGYMSQRFSLYEDMTVFENFRFYAGIYGLRNKTIQRKFEELLRRLDLQQVSHTLIKSLPLGWKQKLAFSIAVAHEPPLVFLDEPTAGVDPLMRKQLWEMIYETASGGTTVFVTTHYMDEAEYCDRVCVMAEGQIKALETPAELKREYHAETMNQVFLKLARINEPPNGYEA